MVADAQTTAGVQGTVPVDQGAGSDPGASAANVTQTLEPEVETELEPCAPVDLDPHDSSVPHVAQGVTRCLVDQMVGGIEIQNYKSQNIMIQLSCVCTDILIMLKNSGRMKLDGYTKEINITEELDQK